MSPARGPIREHPPLVPWWKSWPLVTVVFGAVLLVGYQTYGPVVRWYELSRLCRELDERRSREPDIDKELEGLRTYAFDDSVRGHWSPLAMGKYRVLVSGDCSFSAECDVAVRDGPVDLDNPRFGAIACQGKGLTLDRTEFDVIGLNTFNAPPTIFVRILKNGQPFYEGSPSTRCADEGFCVLPEAPTAAERAIGED